MLMEKPITAEDDKMNGAPQLQLRLSLSTKLDEKGQIVNLLVSQSSVIFVSLSFLIQLKYARIVCNDLAKTR